jgi:hypothetical protein
LDEGGVGESLGVVAEVLAGGGLHLLAVEAERTAEREELVEERLGFVRAAGAGQRLDEPERAGQKGPFATVEAVAAGRVAVQQRSPRRRADGGWRRPFR